MKPQYRSLVLTVLIIALLFYVDPVYAGPGGTIAKALFKTWWGKLLLILLTIVLLPVIIYYRTIEFFAIRKTKKQLNAIGLKNKDFMWLNLDKHVSNIFERVYLAWNEENMSEVSNYVNHWYWQNQQKVHLDKWKSKNLKNVCDLGAILSIKPLYLEITSDPSFDGSKVAMLINANIEDYLIDRTTKRVVEGKKGHYDEEKIWIFEYSEGQWLLDDIKEDSYSLFFAKLKNIVPDFVSENKKSIQGSKV